MGCVDDLLGDASFYKKIYIIYEVSNATCTEWSKASEAGYITPFTTYPNIKNKYENVSRLNRFTYMKRINEIPTILIYKLNSFVLIPTALSTISEHFVW